MASKNIPLSNHLLYDGHDVDDARQVLSRLFTEIAIEPLEPGRPFRAQVNGLQLPRISVCYLRFEYGAVAGPVQPLDFHTLQLNPTGSVVYNTDDGAVAGSDKRGVVLSAGQTVRNRHSELNGNLALIVKDEVMRDYLSMWTGNDKHHTLFYRPDFNPQAPRAASFLRFVDLFVEELNLPGGILEAPAAVASFEHTLLTSMLFGLEHDRSNRLDSGAATTGIEQVRKIEDYIESHAAQPIDMATLAGVSEMSGATIHRAFRRHRGYTPMQFLKNTRMRLARERLLLSHPKDSVTKVALECGFAHLGRFAAEYRCRYGESPSQTLTRRSIQVIA